MRRFWKQADYRPSATGWQIFLDTRELKTPMGQPLELPSEGLASAIAGEWQQAGEEIQPDRMPQFSLAATVLDRVRPQRGSLQEEMTRYGLNDLLCYRTDTDAGLAARQRENWDPWLDWLASRHRLQLAVTDGVMPLQQSAEAAARWPQLLEVLDDWRLGMLVRAAQLGGSAVLGLAFVEGAIEAADLHSLAFLDEIWQAEKWGQDGEAEERRKAIAAELAEAGRLLSLLEAG